MVSFVQSAVQVINEDLWHIWSPDWDSHPFCFSMANWDLRICSVVPSSIYNCNPQIIEVIRFPGGCWKSVPQKYRMYKGVQILDIKFYLNSWNVFCIADLSCQKEKLWEGGLYLNDPEMFFKQLPSGLRLLLFPHTFPQVLHHASCFIWSGTFSSRSTTPSSSRPYNKAASCHNPWASTLASSHTLAASSCLLLTPQCLPMSSSTHWPAWPCSLPPSHPLKSRCPASLSRMLQVRVTALAEKRTKQTLSVDDKLNNWPMVSAGSQDLSHVMGSSGLITGGTGGQEITLTINNPSLTQALASASCSSAGSGNPQEITLTISGIDHFIQLRSIIKPYQYMMALPVSQQRCCKVPSGGQSMQQQHS